jgi:S-DNA-T family DNA segregation ATPase FtsK/SpoIIIE
MDRYISLKDCLKVLDRDKYSLPVILGKDSNNDIHIKDLKDLKNILISGSTLSGKSVFLKSFVNTILLSKTPKEVKFIMIDTKMVELDTYNGIEYLLTPVINDMEEAYQIFSWCLEEIERRVKSNTTNPSIVIIIDEFADVMLTDPYKATRLEKIVKEGSKVGIYTIMSTSSPRKTVVTDTLQKYIKGRLAGALPSSEDSITVLGERGAEDLMGYGDMIFKNMDTNEKIRVQTPLVRYDDVISVVNKVGHTSQYPKLEVEEIVNDEPLPESVKQLQKKHPNLTTNILQRELQIGYSKAVEILRKINEK